ncbi:GNAT superfamily N-acetyltransferase [Paenibacillus shirakamiensis]|uniref:GNAT superfamily N-acetyltransferase n=1 Tax=Paenibacillus shirakamiensis TaxID=1265935 RepID=A0ABS4JLB4_9BACL|nr:GNAT family N-acetyltransferase [Paenibacillus shirakamiensis]MBP2001389.1 GNAT superfamily N-acetyltransferase [Paenibacillus shirakamiensis]
MIRESTIQELRTIIELKLSMFQDAELDHLLNDKASEIIEREYLKMYDQNKIRHFVIDIDNEIAGCAGAFIKNDIPYCFYKTPFFGFIGDVYIKKNFRRKGYAKQLTEEVITWLKSKDVKMIKLLATPEAAGLYSDLGFEKTGDMTLWIDE